MLWVAGRRLKERDSKFAIKAGMATSLLALPAFLETTRPTFVEYYGDWALISVSLSLRYRSDLLTLVIKFFIVISPTIGAVSDCSYHT